MNRTIAWFERLMVSVTFAEANVAEPMFKDAKPKNKKTEARKQVRSLGNKSRRITSAHV